MGDRVEELTRMRRECDRHGTSGPASREVDRRLNQVTVSDVDAVEVSDGEDCGVIVHFMSANNR